MSGLNVNIDAKVNEDVCDVMFTDYDHQAYENEVDDYDTFSADEGNIFSIYNFTSAKRHVRSNVRRKAHSSSQGSLFNGGFCSIFHSTYNDIYQLTHPRSSGVMYRDFILLLRRLVI